DFVGIELRMRSAAEQLADQATDQRNACRAADHDDFVDLGRLQVGVGKRLAARLERPVDNWPDQRLEVRARYRFAVAAGANLRFLAVGQVELGLNDGLADGL